jgi:hypothetical protein
VARATKEERLRRHARLRLSEAKAWWRGAAEVEQRVRRHGSAAGGDTAVHGRSWSLGNRGGTAEQRARAWIDGGGGGWKRD